MCVPYATVPDTECHKPGEIHQLSRGKNATYYDRSRRAMLTPVTRLFQKHFAAQIRAIYEIKTVLGVKGVEMHNTVAYPTQQSSSPSRRIPCSHKRGNDDLVTAGMEEKSSLNMPVQRLKVAILPLDLTCSGPVTHSGEILTTGKSHGKRLLDT